MHRWPWGNRNAPVRALVLVLVPALVLAVAGRATAQDDAASAAAAPTAHEPACLAARNNALAGIAGLAAGDNSYLVLDVAAGEIRIELHGVPLRSFPVQAVQAATEPGATLNVWTVHTAGVFSPARVENPPEELPLTLEGETEEVVQIHLPPAERFPAPATYRLGFPAGLLIEFHSQDGAAAADGGLGARIAGWLGADAAPKPTLRIRMDEAPAGDLYRALPAEVALVIEPDCS